MTEALLTPYNVLRMTSDETLVASYKGGDTEAFTQLYERYFKRIYEFVYFKTHHTETTQDIVSQTFLQAVEKLHSFNPKKGNFSAWLHRIARNLTYDHFRAMKQVDDINDVWDLSTDDDVERDADVAVKIDAVQEVLSQLKPNQREVILLRLWHGYSFKEVAQALDLSEGACKMHYKRGMENVRTEMLTIFFLLFFSL